MNLINYFVHTKPGKHLLKFSEEKGRSMVEMLGVLAVIGVLSITGIAGYKYAMNKYRVNEIINEINMIRAKLALVMEQSHEENFTLSIDAEYTRNDMYSYYFGYDLWEIPQVPNSMLYFSCTENPGGICTPQEKIYNINFLSIPKDLCQLVSSSAVKYMPNIKKFDYSCDSDYEISNSLTFIFEAENVPEPEPEPDPEPDLDDEDPIGEDEPSECGNPKGSEDEENPEEESVCSCSPTQECEESFTYCYAIAAEEKICLKKIGYSKCLSSFYVEMDGFYISSPTEENETGAMSWWSANQFCKSIGKTLVSKKVFTSDVIDKFKSKLGEDALIWTRSRKSHCRPYVVDLKSSKVQIGVATGGGYAVCQ